MEKDKKIDVTATIRRIRGEGYTVAGLSRRHKWNTTVFYQTLCGDRGKTEKAKESHRILGILEEMGLLVHKPGGHDRNIAGAGEDCSCEAR